MIFRNYPFVASTSAIKPLEAIAGLIGGEPPLDHLGQSSLGELYWNNGLPSMGIVCGAFVHENCAIVRRLLGSHLNDSTAEALIIHTDHFAVQNSPCPLLRSEWNPVRILVSPEVDDGLSAVYATMGDVAAPITFKDTSITLRHVMALCTPPPAMEGRSAILVTVQQIISQLRPPFDLQRFIELINEEHWSEEGINFMALRQTLLTKLLSAPLEDDIDNVPRRVTVVDLTDPVLQSTGLDSVLAVIAIHDFIHGVGGRKMIVLNNSQQYLHPSSILTKTLDTLAAQGHDRPAAIILSTMEPSTISPLVLNSLDYAIFGSSRSLPWTEFLHKHFTTQTVPKAQLRIGRTMIWSPSSTMHTLKVDKDDSKTPKAWDDLLAFIDVEQFERSITSNPVSSNLSTETLAGVEKSEGSKPEVKMLGKDANHDEEEEEGIIPLDKLDIANPFIIIDNAPPPSSFSSSGSINGNSKTPSKPNKTPPAKKTHPPSKFYPLASAISLLCDGEIGMLVDFEAVRKQLGPREVVQKLGWATYTQYVKAACENNVVDLIEPEPGSKFLVLPASHDSIEGDAAPLPAANNADTTWLQPTDGTLRPSEDVTPYLDGPENPRVEPNPAHLDPSSPTGSPGGYPEQYAPLVSIILTLSGGRAGHKVFLKSVRTEMGDKVINESMRRYGWSSVDNWIHGACLENYLQQGLSAGSAWVMVNPRVSILRPDSTGNEEISVEGDPATMHVSVANGGTSHGASGGTVSSAHNPAAESPSDDTTSKTTPVMAKSLAQERILEETPSANATASSDPSRHLPIVSNVLKLTGGIPGAEVRMKDLLASLQLEYPRAREDFLLSLVLTAAEDGFITWKEGDGSIVWISLHSPSAGHNIPSPRGQIDPTLSQPTPSSVPPLGDPKQIQEKPLAAVDFPLKHRAVVSTIIKLTSGAPGARVLMAELMESLRGEYRGAKEGFLFSLILAAEKEEVVGRETTPAGLVWAFLAPSTSTKAPEPRTYIASSSPLSHHQVVSAIKHLNRGVTEQVVPLEALCTELCHRGYAHTVQDATDMISAATVAKYMWIQRDEDGERYALLTSPDLSTASSNASIGQKTLTKPPEDKTNDIHHDTSELGASHFTLPTGRDMSTRRESDASVAHEPRSIRSPSSYPEQYALLISAILQVSGGSKGTKVSLSAVRAEMGEKAIMQAMLTYGWTTFGQWVRCACLEKYTEQGGTGEDLWIILNALQPIEERSDAPRHNSSSSPDETYQTPPPTGGTSGEHQKKAGAPPDAAPSSLTTVNASDYPFKHRPVVSAILKLTGGIPGIRIRLLDLTVSLQLNFPRAKDEFLFSLVNSAERDGVLRREKGNASLLWVTLQMPASFGNSPTPSTSSQSPPPSLHPGPPLPPPPPSPPVASSPAQAAPPKALWQPFDAAHFPLKHRAVVSHIIKLTNGIKGAKVRMSDVTGSLRGEYRGAKGEFLFSLIVEAEGDGVLQRETDHAGLVWISLKQANAPYTRSFIFDYPPHHRPVVSVIQSLIGEEFGRGIPLTVVHGELHRQGLAISIEGAAVLTTAAAAAHIMRVKRDENGESYALLEDPKRGGSPSIPNFTAESRSNPPKVTQKRLYNIWDYPLIHRPVVSTVFMLTHGKCGVRVNMESVIRALMTDPTRSGKYRDAGVAASVIVQAADAKVLQCGKDDGGAWWTSVEEPIRSAT